MGFQNDPATVARLFDEALREINYIRRVVFAVLDPGMARTFGEVLNVPVQGLENALEARGKGKEKGKGKGKLDCQKEGKDGCHARCGRGVSRKQRRWQKGQAPEDDA